MFRGKPALALNRAKLSDLAGVCSVLAVAMFAISCNSIHGSQSECLCISKEAAVLMAHKSNPVPDDASNGYGEILGLVIQGDPDALRAILRLIASDGVFGKDGGEENDELAALAYKYNWGSVFWNCVSELPPEKQVRIIIVYNYIYENRRWSLLDWTSERDRYLTTSVRTAELVREKYRDDVANDPSRFEKYGPKL